MVIWDPMAEWHGTGQERKQDRSHILFQKHEQADGMQSGSNTKVFCPPCSHEGPEAASSRRHRGTGGDAAV